MFLNGYKRGEVLNAVFFMLFFLFFVFGIKKWGNLGGGGGGGGGCVPICWLLTSLNKWCHLCYLQLKWKTVKVFRSTIIAELSFWRLITNLWYYTVLCHSGEIFSNYLFYVKKLEIMPPCDITGGVRDLQLPKSRS